MKKLIVSVAAVMCILFAASTVTMAQDCKKEPTKKECCKKDKKDKKEKKSKKECCKKESKDSCSKAKK